MSSRGVSLDDKYTAETGHVLLSGIDALVRLPLDQARQDRANGLNIGGFISGYRGSPLGSYDQRLMTAKSHLDHNDIHFLPGINEDLAATAVWGSQQVNLHPGARKDGVFGIWYGKAPGVDRSGDVFKHANMTGTWPLGGVLAIAGDDPLAKSSSLPNQSEFAFIHNEMPVLTPADIQDVLDLGLHGLAMSRYSGLWTGMIALADLMDGSATVAVDPDRLAINLPPDDGMQRHISLDALQILNRMAMEEALRMRRLPAALRYAKANQLNQVIADSSQAKIGIIASGKSWSAFLAALDLLGLDIDDTERLGLRLMKVSMPWPLEPEGIEAFAAGLDTVLVIESKRPLIEPQLKDRLYHLSADQRPMIVGKTDLSAAPWLSEIGDLDALTIAPALLRLLPKSEEVTAMAAALRDLDHRQTRHQQLATSTSRPPHFCSGCPHSRSTHIPDGSRAMAGIGCHVMTQWMGGEQAGRGPAEGYSQMGGEGAAWLGQTPFTETKHVFVNLGDGTYYHSGLLAIRAAIAASVSVTYKILFNDAVAMTGGQAIDGPLTVERLAAQLSAEGVQKIVVLSEQPKRFPTGALPKDVGLFDRAELLTVQKTLRDVEGVSVLIFDQTCAAEKRRRRKRKLAPLPEKRVMINDRVCEGCGDCSRQSNCLSVEPIETSFGTKRQINQSSCNQDLSCTDGFCPSFVLIEGDAPKKATMPVERIKAAAATLPLPPMPTDIASTDLASANMASANILLSGTGGTGVTTISAMLAMAAHLDGLRVVSTDVTGLAQKGGAVLCYLRFAPASQALHGAKLLPGGADLVIGCDLLVTAGADALKLCSQSRTSVFAERSVAPTGHFALFQETAEPSSNLNGHLRRAANSVHVLSASDTAKACFGDRIFANMILTGAAFQDGKLPLSLPSIEQAIELNGVAVANNLAAFHAGRVLLAAPELLTLPAETALTMKEEDLEALVQRFSDELIEYQSKALSDQFLDVIAEVGIVDANMRGGQQVFTKAVARNLFKLMAYKDEYEVARLYSDPAFREKVRAEFGENAKVSVQLAPPFLSRIDRRTGRPRKMTFGPWVFSAFSRLARLKWLRGTPFDPFGWTQDRRTERQLVNGYLKLIDRILPSLSAENYKTAVALASLPSEISGFGAVKAAKIEAARIKEEQLWATFEKEEEDLKLQHDPESWPIAAE